MQLDVTELASPPTLKIAAGGSGCPRGSLPGLGDSWKDDLLLLNKRLVQDRTLGGQQVGRGASMLMGS